MSDEQNPRFDTKSNLLEAARAAIKEREDKAVADVVAARSVPRRRRIGILGTLGLTGLVLLVLQPDWLVGPKAPPPESAPVAAASLRLALVREQSRVLSYLRQHGALPLRLADAGTERSDITYERTANGAFRLSARAGDSTVVLLSSDSASAFLGASLKAIKNRGRQ